MSTRAHPTILGGDFNVRMTATFPGLGRHALLMPADFSHSEETRTNFDLFSTFIQATDYVVMNTAFEKHIEELTTYVDPLSGSPVQMDFIRVHQDWKNSIQDISTGRKEDLATDHIPLIGKLCAKFAARGTAQFRKPERPLPRSS